MRDLAKMTRRRETRQGWATRSGVAAVVLAIAWVLCPQLAAAAPTPSTAQIQGLEVHEEALGTRVEVTTDGTPLWTTYRDADGNLVVELANSLPADSVTSLTPESGLLQAVEIEVERSSAHPLTRLVIQTRSDAEHSVVADGPNLRIDLIPVGSVASAIDRVEPEAEEPMMAVDEQPKTALAAVEPVPGPSGEPTGDVVASQLQTIRVDEGIDATTVRIVGDGEFFYSTLTLGAPDRFVVDLIGVVNMAPNTNIAVENEIVERIRIAQYKPYPEPVSRVVVDLRDASGAKVAATPDGLMVTFGEGSMARAEPVEALQIAAEEVIAGGVVAGELETEEVVAEWQPAAEEKADEGMGSSETGGTGSHELSSLASAVATDHLEEELAPEPASITPEWTESQPEPVQIAEAHPEPEPTPYSSPDPEDPAAVLERDKPASFESEAVGVRETSYSGEPMTISLKDGDIKDVLRSFAQISGLNVVVQPGVTGTVTVELTDVPWDQALEQILKINGLGYELDHHDEKGQLCRGW